ncbi:MAG: hypothetical protein AAFY41_11930, partial [Bacteroidota bacterium]
RGDFSAVHYSGGMSVIDEPQTMYNLTISLVATYLVGEQGWVVHNTNSQGKICRYLPAGADGQYRLQTKDGPPRGVLGIYEYKSRENDLGLWYVGESHDIRDRLLAEMRDGFFNDWIEVIWTPLNIPPKFQPSRSSYYYKHYLPSNNLNKWKRPSPMMARMLHVAEKIRIHQVYEEFGGNIANKIGSPRGGNPIDLEVFKRILAQGGTAKRSGWPDWLFLYQDHIKDLKF